METLLEKHFYRTSSIKINAWLVMLSGLFLIIFGFSMDAMFLFFGILNLILGILLINAVDKPIISLMNNHIEIKLAPLSATQYIKNSDIKSIENQKDKKLVFHLTTKKKVSFPINLVQKDTRNELITRLISMNNKFQKEQNSGI